MRVLKIVRVKAHERGIWKEDPMADQPGLFGSQEPVAAPPPPPREKSRGCAECFPKEAKIEELKAELRLAYERLEMTINATARRTDPSTSHEAARWANRDKGAALKAFRKEVLRAFVTHGPMTDEKAYEWMTKEMGHEVPKASVAKRRLDLQRMGMIEPTDFKAEVRSGCNAKVWKVSDAGKAAFHA